MPERVAVTLPVGLRSRKSDDVHKNTRARTRPTCTGACIRGTPGSKHIAQSARLASRIPAGFSDRWGNGAVSQIVEADLWGCNVEDSPHKIHHLDMEPLEISNASHERSSDTEVRLTHGRAIPSRALLLVWGDVIRGAPRRALTVVARRLLLKAPHCHAAQGLLRLAARLCGDRSLQLSRIPNLRAHHGQAGSGQQRGLCSCLLNAGAVHGPQKTEQQRNALCNRRGWPSPGSAPTACTAFSMITHRTPHRSACARSRTAS